MKRTFILMMDSFGIGAAADAEKFGDVGANTLGHIAKACAAGEIEGRGALNLLQHIRKLSFYEYFQRYFKLVQAVRGAFGSLSGNISGR